MPLLFDADIEHVPVKRNGRVVTLSLDEVTSADVVCHSDMWWQLCTARRMFAEVEDGAPFCHQGKWYVAEREGKEPLLRELLPNVPLGEPSNVCTRPPFEPSASVDVLDIKLA